MRELEFRGKRIDNGRWAYGGFHRHQLVTPSPLIANDKKPKEVEYAYLIVESGFSDWNMPKPMHAIEVDPETVGQFTGLRDVKRRKIYESDILKGKHYMNGSWHRIIGKVVFVGCSFCIDGVGKYEGFTRIAFDPSFEIIGNTYENPELLEVTIGTEE